MYFFLLATGATAESTRKNIKRKRAN